MVDFLEVRLPEDIERGSRGGPRFSTSKFRGASGFVKRNSNWSQALRSYDISYGLQVREDIAAPIDPQTGFDRILDFYHVVLGEAIGFRFQDFSDFQVGSFDDVTLTTLNTGFVAEGDSSTTVFQLIKRRSLGATNHDRILKKISLDDAGDPIIRMLVNAVEATRVASAPAAGEFSVDEDTGLVTLGDVLTAGQFARTALYFDTPVTFASDMLDVEMVVLETGSIPPIMLEETRIP